MKKNSKIDSIRGIAILAVLLVHTTAQGVNADNDYIRYMNIFIGQLSGFAVPLFVMISGYVLSIKYFEKLSTIKVIKSFYFKRAKKILIPYIAFSSIFILFHIPFGHFWFFNLILYLYLLYPLMVQSRSNQILISIVLCLSALSTEYILYVTGLSINPVFHPKYILYMWMGIFFYKNDVITFDIIRKYKTLLIILYIILLIAQTTLTYLGSELNMYIEIWSAISLLSISIALLGIFYMILNSNNITSVLIDNLNYFGKISFSIYIIHIVFLIGTKLFLLLFLTNNNLLFYIIILLNTILFSIIFTKVLSRYRLGALLLSVPLSNYKKEVLDDK